MGWLCVPAGGRSPSGSADCLTPNSKMTNVKCEFMTNFTSEEVIHYNKISIIGTDSIGLACAITILLEGLSDEHAFVHVDEANRRAGQWILNMTVLS